MKASNATAIETLPSPEELAKQGFETVSDSRPSLYDLKSMKPRDVIDGTLKEIRPSLRPEITTQPLLLMELTKDKSQTLVPVKGGISVKIFANPEEKAQRKSRFLGKRILIAMTGHKRSKTYKDDSGQGREFATFEVIEYKGK
ncbi:MAG: hypothetical protein EBX52_13710 [Proteobacteria bacterium]|nr:hypothetical protein [Pseudomonadota bacterium]